MFTKRTFTHMKYLPRNSTYRILHHNIKIKSENGKWTKGCAYVGEDQQIYVRPYDLFKLDKFEFYIKEGEFC